MSLDEQMGAMAIIAPYIQAAQDALAEATAQAEDLKAKLEEHNKGNLPTLFVEGPTDYLVFKTLLRKFRPDQAELVYLAEPPQRAGANYVTNMLRSWEYRTKHYPPADRALAVGIVDDDGEGRSARERFEGEGVNWKQVSLVTLNTPAHLLPAKELGIEIPVTLEELWPIAFWNHAEAQAWLTDRPVGNILSEDLVKRLVGEDLKLSELISDDWRIYYERCADSSAGSQAKSAWAAYAASQPRAQLEQAAAAHLGLLDQALGKLGV